MTRVLRADGPSCIEIPGSRYGIAVGPRIAIRSGSQTLAKIGGEPPEKILIFPYPQWELVDDKPGEHLITDEASQAAIVEAFTRHGVDVVIDYEHASTTGGKAPAGGWIKSLVAGGKDGLVGGVEWTGDAAEEIRKGQYRYHSPVAIYERESRRVVALHSVALTNTPRTNNMAPITEQVAASLITRFETAKGGWEMRDWLASLIYFLNMPYTATAEEVKAQLQRIMDSLGKDTAAAKDGEQPATIAAAIGFLPESEVTARIEAALKEKGTAAASAEVLTLLELEATADLPTVIARVASLKHHEGLVSAEEHQKVVARLAELDETAKKDRVEQLLTANAAKLTPAMKEEFRKIAGANFTLAEQTLAKMPELKPKATAAGSAAPPEPEVDKAEATIETPEGERRVDPEKAAIVARNREIQKEKGVSYTEANTLRLRELATAAK